MPPIRPWKTTGAAPSTASRTSSTIWPADSSTTRSARSRGAIARIASAGNGHRVIGRKSPTRMPAARAWAIAVRATRAAVP